MAIPVEKITLGIDVCKDTLDVYRWDDEQRWQLANDAKAIRKLLKSFTGPVQICIEPTSSYHLTVVEVAHSLDQALYLINPRQLVHYRTAVGQRNKTDATDAWLLARYLERERDQLRRFEPPSYQAQQLWSLLKRRALIVSTQQQLRQSLAPVKLSAKAVQRELTQLIKRIDARITRLISQLGWSDDYQRCRTMPGIGPVNAAALVAAFHRGAFASADAFIAYLGLDVRIRESGQYKGKRKLTKHGEPELRRLLWCATRAACNYPPFAEYRQRQLDKGLSKIAARVVLARKLARIAFALMRDESTFRKQTSETCMNP